MLRVFNESKKVWVTDTDIRGIVYISDEYVEKGYFSKDSNIIFAEYENSQYAVLNTEHNRKFIKFNRTTGYYIINKNFRETRVFGYGNFPYTFAQKYSTRFLEETFEKSLISKELIDFKYIDELPYTFGLEFETAGGYIPEITLKESGLIPLRDGSIQGIEYSTIVLQGNKGLNILKQQIEILKEYTIFDKNCSLHIHFGNFKLSPEILLRINNLFSKSSIDCYLPNYVFNTTLFKKNTEKNYCKRNVIYSSFEEMYYELVGRDFYGDLYQPHPNDTKSIRKWEIKSRYKAVNFINALCYNFGKTIEFRFLHPTYNFDRILCWIFILGAYIKYAEKYNDCNSHDLKYIISNVYSPELTEILINALNLQYDVIEAQNLVDDYYGGRIDIEDSIMTYNNLNINNNFFY